MKAAALAQEPRIRSVVLAIGIVAASLTIGSRSLLRLGAGGSSGPSFGRELFSEACAPISVPSAEK
jgi:hypothetical protein